MRVLANSEVEKLVDDYPFRSSPKGVKKRNMNNNRQTPSKNIKQQKTHNLNNSMAVLRIPLNTYCLLKKQGEYSRFPLMYTFVEHMKAQEKKL